MEKITIVIECGNAAFTDAPELEVARILREMAERLETSGIPPVPRDYNGNKVGSVTVE